MKRALAFLLLIIFLFNVGGFYIVFWAMGVHAKQSLLQRLEVNDYASKDLVVLPIPLSLPYPIHNGGYERVDGEFQLNGQYFRLVKQKVQNDTLYVVCIKDDRSSTLASALSDYSQYANNLPAGSKEAINFLGKIHKDYKSTELKMIFKSRILFERTYYAEHVQLPTLHTLGQETPPPELLF